VTQRHKVSTIGKMALAAHRVAPNLQSVKNTRSAKCSKVKCNETRYTLKHNSRAKTDAFK